LIFIEYNIIFGLPFESTHDIGGGFEWQLLLLVAFC
jgi:hypothetical protein